MALNPEFQAALASIIRPIYATDLPDNLEAMRGWLDMLGLSKPAFPVIAVAGSVGKGSTALALARHLSQFGWRIGLYTSPHLHSFRERFQIDGEMISQEAFAFHANRVVAATQTEHFQPSTFETATLIAFDWFTSQQIDLAICEIGMGGRFDAVNAVGNQLAIFTPVEMEHAAALGGILDSIAWHKAGILQSGEVGISLPQSAPVKAVFEQAAAAIHAEIIPVSDETELLNYASRVIRDRLPTQKREQPPRWAKQLPGRLEVVSAEERTYVIDGAHTVFGATRLRAYLATLEPQPILLIAALLRDKAAVEILRPFNHAQFRVVLAPLSGHRSAKPDEILSQWQPDSATVEIADSVDSAVEAARYSSEHIIVICGSLRTAALARETLGLLSNDALDESRFTRSLFENDSYLRSVR